MIHPLVTQLHFARSELARCLAGVSDADARRRLEPTNCLSWIVGHLASQENNYWVLMAQNIKLYPKLYKLVGYGSPPSTPPLDEMWDAWREIGTVADNYLEALTPAELLTHLHWCGEPRSESIGTMLQRNIFHYWFHIGEAHAIRQQLGHPNLPEFVGKFGPAIYRPA